MRSYTIKTHAAAEFDHDFWYANVIDTHYEGPNGEILVIDTEIAEDNEPRYQRELERDTAVISYVCNTVFEAQDD